VAVREASNFNDGKRQGSNPLPVAAEEANKSASSGSSQPSIPLTRSRIAREGQQAVPLFGLSVAGS